MFFCLVGFFPLKKVGAVIGSVKKLISVHFGCLL